MKNISNTTKAYTLVFLFEFFKSPFYGISSLFLMHTLNLKIYQISLIKIFAPITILLAELPTGMLADKYGRKACFILSCFICGIGFAIYAIAQNFWQAIFAEIFYALGLAFQTGSIDSLLISQIKEDNSISLSKVLSKFSFARSLGLMLGGSLGILLSFKSMRLPWVMATLGSILVGFLSFSLTNQKIKKVEFKGEFIKYFKNRDIIMLTIICVGVVLINIPFFNYWQIFLESVIGISRRSYIFVAIYASYNLLIALGSLFYHNVFYRLGKRTLITTSLLIAITSIMMVITSIKSVALFFFFIAEFLRGIFYTSFNYDFNDSAPDDKRSWYNSQLSAITKVISIFAYLLSSLIAVKLNVSYNILILSSLGFILILIPALSKKAE